MEDHKKVPIMEQRELVTHINNFISTTVMFLNDFLHHSETKMMKSEQRLQKISASLCILESKLNSVPELREPISQKIPMIEPLEISSKPVMPSENVSTNVEKTGEPKKTEDNISQPVEPTVIDESPKDLPVDPALLKYRKMLQVGVPRAAVELKMKHEGLDPELL